MGPSDNPSGCTLHFNHSLHQARVQISELGILVPSGRLVLRIEQEGLFGRLHDPGQLCELMSRGRLSINHGTLIETMICAVLAGASAP